MKYFIKHHSVTLFMIKTSFRHSIHKRMLLPNTLRIWLVPVKHKHKHELVSCSTKHKNRDKLSNDQTNPITINTSYILSTFSRFVMTFNVLFLWVCYKKNVLTVVFPQGER